MMNDFYETEQLREKTKQKQADLEIAKYNLETWQTKLKLATLLINSNNQETIKLVEKVIRERTMDLHNRSLN